MIVYRVDRDDSIVYVNAEWERFAQENAGGLLVTAKIIHTSIWDHVTDSITIELYREIMRGVREGRPVQFTFRCDAPDLRRLLTMSIQPLDKGGVEFTTTLIRAESRTYQRVLEPAGAGGVTTLNCCSWCKRFEVRGSWVEVEDAVEQLKLFERANMPLTSHGICADCFRRMKELEGAP
ncbi:MAG: hypothetical protein AMXMBFR84_19110 [Candidatus Hydrogenedentota bacterium]